MFPNVEGSASGRRRATLPYRAAVTLGTEECCTTGADSHGDVVGAGHRFGVVVNSKIVSGELVVAKSMVAFQGKRFDHNSVLSIFQIGTDLTGPVCRIGENL